MNDAVTTYRINEAKRSIRREYAELVYHYPGYTLEDAEDMPVGDRNLLLTYARLHRAELLFELLSIIAAAQSKAGYKKKFADLEGVIKDLTKQL
jgi:hypothetical protein